MRQLAESKVKGAVSLLDIRERMSRPIAMIVIMNNIANIVGSMVIGSMATEVFITWIGVFSGGLTFMVIIFSDYSQNSWRETQRSHLLSGGQARFDTHPIDAALIWLIEKITNPFTTGSQPEFSTNEKEIDTSRESGMKRASLSMA